MSTLQQNQTLNIPLEVGVKRADYDRLCEHIPDKSSPNQVIARLVSHFIAQYSQGGLLLKSTDVDYLSKITGEQINEPAQIARHVEASVKRKLGQHTVEVGVDPAYIGVLAERAKERGMTLDEIVTDCVGQCFDNGWLYNMLPGRNMAAFTDRQCDELKQLIGKQNFNGEDIMKLIRSASVAEAA